MRPFQFRLETLLRYRRIQEEQAQVRLAEATAAFVAARDRLTGLENGLAGHLEGYRRSLAEPVTVATLKVFRDYSDKLKEDIDAQVSRVAAADDSRRESIAALEEAVKARKLVERLREKRLAQYQAEALREEQRLLDEQGLQAFGRGR